MFKTIGLGGIGVGGVTLAALLTGTAPVALAAQDQAGAQGDRQVAEECMTRLQDLDRAYTSEGMTLGGRDLRTLFNAANVFANNGQKEACMAVVDGMETYAEQVRSEGQGMQDIDDWKQATNDARPLDDDSGFTATQYMDDSVVSPEGVVLGEIEDVVTTGEERYLVVGSGGFLGVGENHRPVELERFRKLDDSRLILPVSEESFEQAPAFDLESIGGQIQAWSNDVEDWWEKNVSDE